MGICQWQSESADKLSTLPPISEGLIEYHSRYLLRSGLVKDYYFLVCKTALCSRERCHAAFCHKEGFCLTVFG